jgi:hypothetical protein
VNNPVSACFSENMIDLKPFGPKVIPLLISVIPDEGWGWKT